MGREDKSLSMSRALIEPRKAGATREIKQKEKNYLTRDHREKNKKLI